MPPFDHDAFTALLKDLPEEQRQLLDEMMKLGLVVSYRLGADSRWWVKWTPAGRRFIETFHAVTLVKPPIKRLLVLDALARDAVIAGGFRE